MSVTGKLVGIAVVATLMASSANAICPYDVNCLNNPYSGRDNSSQGIVAAPYSFYGNTQYNSSFGSNPLRDGAVNNPYAPPPSAKVGLGGAINSPVSTGLGVGTISGPGSLTGGETDLLGRTGPEKGGVGAPGSLQGVDADVRSARGGKIRVGRTTTAGPAPLKGVDPDLQR